jgi:hypothetical protein
MDGPKSIAHKPVPYLALWWGEYPFASYVGVYEGTTGRFDT